MEKEGRKIRFSSGKPNKESQSEMILSLRESKIKLGARINILT